MHENHRQNLVRALRQSGLLPVVERARFLTEVVQSTPSNTRFQRTHPSDPMPPKWLTYDAFSFIDYDRYWKTGQLRAAYLADLARTYGAQPPLTICDWGCGPARIVRHLARDHGDTFDRVIGTDYNEQSIKWCRANVTGVEFLVNSLSPPLALADSSVDFIYSFSVFTHLSEPMMKAWMAEQQRVVRPGGLIMLTTHGDQFRHKLLPDEQHQYDTTGLVVRGSVREGSRVFASFTSPDFVQRTLGVGMELVFGDERASYDISSRQDVWVFRRP